MFWEDHHPSAACPDPETRGRQVALRMVHPPSRERRSSSLLGISMMRGLRPLLATRIGPVLGVDGDGSLLDSLVTPKLECVAEHSYRGQHIESSTVPQSRHDISSLEDKEVGAVAPASSKEPTTRGSKTHNLQQTYAPLKVGLGMLGDKLENNFGGSLILRIRRLDHVCLFPPLCHDGPGRTWRGRQWSWRVYTQAT